MASPKLATLIQRMKDERAPVTQLLQQVLAGQVPDQTFLDLARQQPPPAISAECWRAVNAAGVRGEWITAPGVTGTATILYFHGGGWFRGSPAVYREFLLRLSAAGGARVFGAQYRLTRRRPSLPAWRTASRLISGCCAKTCVRSRSRSWATRPAANWQRRPSSSCATCKSHSRPPWPSCRS